MTYDDVVRIALSLTETEEGMSWGTPGVKRNKRFMFRLREDGETIAIKLDWDTHDRLLAESPHLYFKTPHYEGHPAFLARFELMSEEDAEALIRASWEDAPFPSVSRKR
jgi:hypothetical protein